MWRFGRTMGWTAVAGIGLGLLAAAGCAKREAPPPSAYDPELVETLERAQAEDRERAAAAARDRADPADAQAECTWETGGCPDGSICFDSWYCRRGRPDQCGARGDQRCHPRCDSDEDCPAQWPLCRDIPMFKGSDRGQLERFCVAEET